MNKVRIYGAEWCSYCKKAVALAEEKGIEYEYADIDDPDQELSEQHRNFMREEAHRSIPQIYEWDDEGYQFKRHIGGYMEFHHLLTH